MNLSLTYPTETQKYVAVASLVKTKTRKVIETLWIVDGTRVLVAEGADKPKEGAPEIAQLERLGPVAHRIQYRTKRETRSQSGESPFALAHQAYIELRAEYGAVLTADPRKEKAHV